MQVECAGVILFSYEQGVPLVLLIKHQKGHYWGFPKGHRELGEDLQDTAKRELLEETGIHNCSFFEQIEPLEESYSFYSQEKQEQIHKKVSYFLATTVAREVFLQKDEICDFCWVEPNEAMDLLIFPERIALLQKALACLL